MSERFEFTPDNLAIAQKYIAKYPEGRQASAVLPLLDLAQRQNDGWASDAVIDAVAELLGMPGGVRRRCGLTPTWTSPRTTVSTAP